MANAHCICPNFIREHIKDPFAYTKVFMGCLLQSDDQIVLDQQELLANEYLKVIKDDTEAFQNYSIWKMLLDSSAQGKKLISTPDTHTELSDTVLHTLLSAITNHDKSIIAFDNNHYEKQIDTISRERINLLNLNNLLNTPIDCKNKKILGFSKFESDLEWVLERIGRTCRKSFSEDSDNDHLRDLLEAKEYSIKDQTREGSSASGIGAGEVDLLIQNNGRLYTIIEAMKLASLKESYIDEHYLKLTTNYNPLSVKRTFLITYYTGKSFITWWQKYYQYISTLPAKKISSRPNTQNLSIDEIDSQLHGLKKLYHHISIDGELSTCVHYAIRLES